MTTTVQLAGYLDTPYLAGPYLGGSNQASTGLQFLAVIDTTRATGAQFRASIDAISATGLQFLGNPGGSHAEGLQFLAGLTTLKVSGLQFRGSVDAKKASGLQFRADRGITHREACDASGYLNDPYLSYPYLTGLACAHMGLQFNGGLTRTQASGVQFLVTIPTRRTSGLQFRGVINAKSAYGLQFSPVTTGPLGLQFQTVLYNTDNLRILRSFPSRGSDGLNWVANSTAPGNFSINNVNTDVIEQVWRSATGAVTGVQLTCDTGVPQGVFLDTLAILGHNLTTSANITLLGSNDPTFGSIGVSIELQARKDDIYYIAGEYPIAGYRYWRFLIDDATNAVVSGGAGYLQIGIVVFGNAVVFQGECFTDVVNFALKDFKDTIVTAGHTNASNSRAVRRTVSLDFRSLRYLKGNFRAMRSLFQEVRTVFKCLWLPTPDPTDQEYTARYAVFSKLVTIPSEQHKVISRDADYVSFAIELDESL